METKQAYQRLDKSSTGSLETLAIFSLVSAKIGVGMVVLPYAMAQHGLLLGIGLCVLAALCCVVYYVSLAKTCEHFQVANVLQLTEHIFGWHFRVGLQLAMAAMAFGTMILFIVLSSLLLSSLLVSAGILDSVANAKQIVTLGLLLVWWVPLLLYQERKWLGRLAMLRIVGICYATLVVIWQSPSYLETFEGVEWQWVGDKCAIGLFYFAFDALPVLPVIKASLKKPEKLKTVLFQGYSALLAFCVILGTFGYVSYRAQVPEIVLFRPTLSGTAPEFDWVLVLARVLMFLALAASAPMVAFKLRDSVKVEPSANKLAGVSMLAIAGAIGLLYPVPMTYFKVLGGIFSPFLSFVCPAVLYMQTSEAKIKKGALGLGALILFAAGLASL